jgi:hypothetical protein
MVPQRIEIAYSALPVATARQDAWKQLIANVNALVVTSSDSAARYRSKRGEKSYKLA